MEKNIQTMIKVLANISEEAWGGYAFYHEPLERKFTVGQKKEYTRCAIKCGEEEARLLQEQYGELPIEEIMKNMGLTIATPDIPSGGGHVTFAQYVEPDEITVFMDCVKKARRLMEEEELMQYLPGLSIYDLLLTHELFHVIEYRKEKTIYTQTEKVELWRKPFSNRSRIFCLSEIAAMAFARSMQKLTFSPYVLDVLLMYSYNKEAAVALYEEILEAAGVKENEEC